MRIGLAMESDFEQLANIRWMHEVEDDEVDLSTANKTEYIKNFCEFMQAHQEYKGFVVREGKKIISSMFVYIIPKIPKPLDLSRSIAYLTKVFTLKEYRNLGYGKKLLDHIKAYLKKNKCELIFVWPSEKSQKWYTRNGFARDNEICECILNEEQGEFYEEI